jgi:transcription elongation factor
MVDRIDPATTPAEYAAVNAASTSNYSTSSSASADAARTDSQNGGGRRRAMSVATGTPNVETVVVKAKRAASTIWTLLHAQVGFLAGNRFRFALLCNSKI